MSTPIFTVVFRFETTEGLGCDEVSRLHFSTLDAIFRKLPDILYDRYPEVVEAIETARLTVTETVAFLANPKNLCKFLELGNGFTAVVGHEIVYN